MSETKENIIEETIQAANEQVTQAVNNMTGMFEGADTAVPEAVRALAEQTVTQSREAYENAKGAMEEAVEVLEKSIDQTGQGVAAINRKALGIAQTNLNTSFGPARRMSLRSWSCNHPSCASSSNPLPPRLKSFAPFRHRSRPMRSAR
jgi:uncharacterized protein (UPF0147 family)